MPVTFAPKLEGQALLFERLVGVAGEFGVHPRQDAVHVLEDGDLAAEAGPHRAELQADEARPDHRQAAGHLGERQRARRVDHGVPVDVDAGQGRHPGAGGDHHVFCRRLAVAVVCVHDHRAGCGDLGGPGVAGNPVLLHQVGDAVGVRLHHGVLALHHGGEVQRDVRDRDAVRLEVVLGFGVALAGLQQGLAGDAADPQAGPAQGGLLLDQPDVQAQLRAADRRNVPAGAGPDDQQIVSWHGRRLLKSRRASARVARWRP
ncbi:MAG: hypothetical protein U5K81_10630 [Trueperaceae bacterium]|nr:hypothetical protein [Trueperaceae bacterium]